MCAFQLNSSNPPHHLISQQLHITVVAKSLDIQDSTRIPHLCCLLQCGLPHLGFAQEIILLLRKRHAINIARYLIGCLFAFDDCTSKGFVAFIANGLNLIS